ncbi:MAG: 1-deoxy-D-xylulose-5-phosphate reductoisomerase [Rhodospirillales bacterium]|nr:1-deoxy-D-xylulose-5-phosphate reductoisomerase [Rhodospirillales bacterium]
MAITVPSRDAPRRVTILGSTGSVGGNTLDLIERNPDCFAVEALTAGGNVALLAEQARRLRPRRAVIADPGRYRDLADALAGTGIEVAAGEAAVTEAAAMPAEWVMSAIVGAAGLEPTLAAARRGAVVALANKECLVCAGDLLMREIAAHGATLLPVDSEHSAIFQVFDFVHAERVEKIVLTASGGPFREFDLAAMAKVTPAQAVAHPNWTMGAKISVDSATMMNKGLELIEAFHLFPVPAERIEILVHPQSVIHSMVAYVDGSVLAQLGSPDMRTPIAYALGWPNRMPTPAARLDLARIGSLTFAPPDPVRFPALRLARQALQRGGGAPTILNAANEVAVRGFLAGGIGFLDIVAGVEETLATVAPGAPASLAEFRALDAEARRVAGEVVRALAARV